jgi:hypothetical protein
VEPNSAGQAPDRHTVRVPQHCIAKDEAANNLPSRDLLALLLRMLDQQAPTKQSDRSLR